MDFLVDFNTAVLEVCRVFNLFFKNSRSVAQDLSI